MELPSKALQRVVDHFASLPGIGSKTALRLTLHLLNQPKEDILQFSEALKALSTEIFFCKNCHNLTQKEHTLCEICIQTSRDQNTICIVESLRDLLAIERTNQFKGVYHILGGIISPMEGISPSQLNIESLISRVEKDHITEVFFALPTTMEGDTTCFYIHKKLKPFSIKISTLARGIPLGDELEYTDELTLGRSLLNRIPYEESLTTK